MARIRHRSKKMESLYATQRRKIVADLLGDNPLCQRCISAYASDVHELKTRARGGSITDLNNLVVLCRGCHTWITQNPKLALEQGWLKNSWDD
jgi:5-methylcytosine-specific restriction endonuclease McrA